MADLLNEEDKREIAAAIHRAEEMTSGEIVFAVAHASARYPQATYQGALAGAVTAAAVYLALPYTHYISLLLLAQAIGFGVCYALFARGPWRRWFLGAAEMEARARQAAFAEFYASGLYRTRDANGVLIYLSCFERRVVVLGDRAIHEKMGDRWWDALRDTIIDGIRRGHARQGICAAVEMCGRALAEHFPHAADDRNELPDDVIDRGLPPE
jgi:putative membrane protein